MTRADRHGRDHRPRRYAPSAESIIASWRYIVRLNPIQAAETHAGRLRRHHQALAHPLRRDILRWLKEPQRYFAAQHHSLENGVCAGQIDQRAGLSQSTVSAHTATLQRAGLVTCQKVGQWHFSKRNDAVIRPSSSASAGNSEPFLAPPHRSGIAMPTLFDPIKIGDTN